MKLYWASLILIFAIDGWAQPRNSPEFFLKVKRKKIEVIRQAADFHPNETIADVGAGGGWLDVAFGIYYDSLHFYLEEVDSTFIKNNKLQEAITAYSKIRNSPFSCSYVQTEGNEKSTQLPENHFDKVLLIDAFHHLDFRDDMLADLHRILKAHGKLIMYEAIARKPGETYRSCKRVIYTREQIVDALAKHGFRLNRIYRTVNSNRSRVRVFTFSKGE